MVFVWAITQSWLLIFFLFCCQCGRDNRFLGRRDIAFCLQFRLGIIEEESQESNLDVHDEILQASLIRTVDLRAADFPAYRVSGSKTNSSKPKAKNRARKEVTQLEQRQYRQHFLEAKMSEHKSWVDNDVYDLVDMSKHPPNNFVKGRWVLKVKRNKRRKVLWSARRDGF